MGAINNALQKKQDTAKPKDPVRALVESMAPALARALPKHVDSERYSRIAMTAIRNAPQLGECLSTREGKMSLLGSLMQSAQLGLEPGVLGSCYILPFRKSFKDGRGQWGKRMEAQFVIGYRGMIDLARRSGAIKTLYANEVCENDELEMSYGVGGTLKHVPNLRGDRGEVIGYYAFAQLQGGDGAYQYIYWPKESVIEHAKEHSETWGRDWSPWTKHFDGMAKKTMIRQLFKILPVSVELQYADAHDEKVVKADADGELTIDIEDAEYQDVPPALETVPDEAPEEAPAGPTNTYSHEGRSLRESGIHGRTLNALAEHGITTAGDVGEHLQGVVGEDGAQELAKLDGVGEQGAREVVEFCFPETEGVDALIQEAREAYLTGDQAKTATLMGKMDDVEKADFKAWAKSTRGEEE